MLHDPDKWMQCLSGSCIKTWFGIQNQSKLQHKQGWVTLITNLWDIQRHSHFSPPDYHLPALLYPVFRLLLQLFAYLDINLDTKPTYTSRVPRKGRRSGNLLRQFECASATGFALSLSDDGCMHTHMHQTWRTNAYAWQKPLNCSLNVCRSAEEWNFLNSEWVPFFLYCVKQ